MKLLAHLLVFGCLGLCILGFAFLCLCVWGYQNYGWPGIAVPSLGLVVVLVLLKVLLKRFVRWVVLRMAMWKGNALRGAVMTVTAITREAPNAAGAPVFAVAFTITPADAGRAFDPTELLVVPEASVISYDENQADDTIGHFEEIDVKVGGEWVRDFDKLKGVQEFRARLVITGPDEKTVGVGSSDGVAIAVTTAPWVVPARVKVQNWFSYIGVIALPAETTAAEVTTAPQD